MEDHMRIPKLTIIWGWMILWVLIGAKNLFSSPVPSENSNSNPVLLSDKADDADREMDRFFKAKEHVFKRNWEKARDGFESYLKDYPRGRLRDEGLYWLASSLNMLSKKEMDEKIVTLKEEAVSRLNELIDLHPQSLWIDDGMALRIEIASQLVLLGKDDYSPIIEEAVRMQKKDASRLRMLALRSLADMDEAFVRPLLQNILKTESDSDIRKLCVQLLGRYFFDSSYELLQELASGDKDREIREEAELWIDRIDKSHIPVYMKFDIYGSRLLDDSLFDEFPEGQVRTIPLQREGQINSRNVPDLIRPVFKGKLSTMSSSANGAIPYPGFYLREPPIITTNRAGDYQLLIKPDELAVSKDQISGVIEFRHRQTNKKTNVPFLLNRDEKKLLTTRSGNTVSLMVIQFMEEPKNSANLQPDRSVFNEDLNRLMDLSNKIGRSDRDPYRTVFNVMMGWTVNSSREYWSINDLIGKTGEYDFGQAEAVSSDPEGWKLVGDLILLTEERQFIGRKAVLWNPEGKTAASGDEIVVPVDDPQNFRVKDRSFTEATGSELPDYGLFESKAVFRIDPDVEIRTDREYFQTEEFSRNLVSFGRSRASIPEKPSTSVLPAVEGMWTLLGDIFWIKEKKLLVGSDALVVDPEREVKAYGLIEVPIENPSAFRLLQGTVWNKGTILERENERYTRTYYSTQISGVQDWEVWTVLQSGPLRAGGGIDYGQSRAVRILDGRDWILIGQITLLPERRTFLARQAALIDSDGNIVFGTEIEVPTDNPAGTKVIQK